MPTVLALTSFYLPGFRAGGPVRSVSGLIDQLGDSLTFKIITRDHDLGERRPYSGIRKNEWTAIPQGLIYYRSAGPWGLLKFVATLLQDRSNVLYLNSNFDLQSTILPLVVRRLGIGPRPPLIIAPRGEFSAGALGLKPGRKRLYLEVARRTGLFRDAFWHASSDAEQVAIIAATGAPADRVIVAPNLSVARKALGIPKDSTGSGPIRVVFLSRLSKMKNLWEALSALGKVKVPMTFDIYGVSDDPAYVQQCQDVANRSPAHVAVRFMGPAAPDQVERILAGYDLFFLPTRGENYGHAIREALSAGVPVLISDQTPWRGLAEKNAGADLPLNDLGAFARWIDDFAALPPERRLEMRKAARELGDDPVVSARNLEANRRMFEAVLASARG